MSLVEIRPTILEVPKKDFTTTLEAIKPLVTSLHLDIEDGKFVERETSYSPDLVSHIKENYSLQIDMHLMVTTPLGLIDEYSDAGADIFSFHLESSDKPEEVIAKIKERKKLACLALKLETKVALSKPYWPDLEEILLMSVNPGWGGQEFHPEVLPRIKELRNLGFSGKIKIDGGLSVEVAKELVASGADVLVIGTALFESGNIEINYKKLVDSL